MVTADRQRAPPGVSGQRGSLEPRRRCPGHPPTQTSSATVASGSSLAMLGTGLALISRFSDTWPVECSRWQPPECQSRNRNDFNNELATQMTAESQRNRSLNRSDGVVAQSVGLGPCSPSPPCPHPRPDPTSDHANPLGLDLGTSNTDHLRRPVRPPAHRETCRTSRRSSPSRRPRSCRHACASWTGTVRKS